MRTVQLEAIEAQRLRVRCRVGEGLDQVIDVSGAERDPFGRTVEGESGGTDRWCRIFCSTRPSGADMPQLRNDFSSGVVHRGDNPAPAAERVISVEPRDSVAGAR